VTSLRHLWTARCGEQGSRRRPAHRSLSANARMQAPFRKYLFFILSGTNTIQKSPSAACARASGQWAVAKRPVSCRVEVDRDSRGAQVTGRATVHWHPVVARGCAFAPRTASGMLRRSVTSSLGSVARAGIESSLFRLCSGSVPSSPRVAHTSVRVLLYGFLYRARDPAGPERTLPRPGGHQAHATTGVAEALTRPAIEPEPQA
jgi:hypothetical protein